MARTIEEVAKRFVELSREVYKKKTSEEMPEHWARILEKGFYIGATWQNIVGADAFSSPTGEVGRGLDAPSQAGTINKGASRRSAPTTKLTDKTICGS